MNAVQLADELQRSRHRLASAREEERRRLRRDLHDRLGPSLAALHIQSNELRRLIRGDPAAAKIMVDKSKIETREAIAARLMDYFAATTPNPQCPMTRLPADPIP